MTTVADEHRPWRANARGTRARAGTLQALHVDAAPPSTPPGAARLKLQTSGRSARTIGSR
jgi:hypothetical protein